VFGTLELVDGSRNVERLLIVLAAASIAAPVYLLAARRLPLGPLVTGVLVLDTLFIAAMEAALRNPNVPVVGYFWALALSAFVCGPAETLGFTLLAIACALVVPPVAGFHVDSVALTTGTLVLALIGGILAYLSRSAQKSEAQLARDRAADAAALHLAELVHSSLNLDRVLSVGVAELGRACDASHAALRLAPGDDGWPRLYQWHRPGSRPFDHPVPPEPVQRMFASGETIVVHDLDDADEEMLAYLGQEHARAFVAVPVRWQGRVAAVVALQDDRPRKWTERALPLLERVIPQLAAALAQAELFEQQQATLAQLEELSRLREEVVAHVSHELRTPLTSTLGFLHTLERTDVDFDDEERRTLIGIARAEAERLAVLVDDLLQLARLDRGGFELDLGPVDLGELMRRAARAIAVPDGREITVAIDGEVVAHADGRRLLQVFTNLLTNAIRHGQGTVEVVAEEAGEEVVLAVSDWGAAIPPERRGELFVPFARWGSSHESTGLGLAIAQGIVRAHGGHLIYRPPSAGRPHAFVVTLPREPAPIRQSLPASTVRT
jgi:signal transduction histidine kinase